MRVRLLVLPLLLSLSVAARADEPASTAAVTRVYDVRMKDEAAIVGTRTVKTQTRPDGRTTIVESLSLKLGGKLFGWTSTVVYQGTGPLEAKARTFLDDPKKACMIGSVTFDATHVSREVSGYLSKRGEVHDPPLTRQDKHTRPLGDLLFQSAAEWLAPRLLEKAGSAEMSLVEFPDDLGYPELIMIKTSCRLTREAPVDGRVRFLIAQEDNRGGSRPLMELHYDAKGVAVEIVLGKIRMTLRAPKPVDEKK